MKKCSFSNIAYSKVAIHKNAFLWLIWDFYCSRKAHFRTVDGHVTYLLFQESSFPNLRSWKISVSGPFSAILVHCARLRTLKNSWNENINVELMSFWIFLFVIKGHSFLRVTSALTLQLCEKTALIEGSVMLALILTMCTKERNKVLYRIYRYTLNEKYIY